MDNIYLEGEVWKDVPWYEGLYQASNLWRIKSFKRWKEKLLSLRTKGKNSFYKSVVLSKDLIEKNLVVHRIVASCFLWLDLYSYKDPKTSLCVCHRDDNPSNNRLDNLFLGTSKQNSLDRESKWRNWMKWKFWAEHNLSKTVYQIKDWEIVNTFGSTLEAERITRINSRCISKCAIWKANSAWWYQWKY
jgi:hypothetical protein